MGDTKGSPLPKRFTRPCVCSHMKQADTIPHFHAAMSSNLLVSMTIVLHKCCINRDFIVKLIIPFLVSFVGMMVAICVTPCYWAIVRKVADRSARSETRQRPTDTNKRTKLLARVLTEKVG